MKLKIFIALAFACITSFVFAGESSQKDAASYVVNENLQNEKSIGSFESKPIEILLLVALPGSGKSEVRRYLSSLTKEERLKQFEIGDFVQLDDFPYVHMMRRISEELQVRGYDGMFFLSSVLPFRDPIEWGTLMQLINADVQDLVNQNKPTSGSASEWLFSRIDAARIKAGGKPLFAVLDPALRQELAKVLEKESKKLQDGLVSEFQDLKGKTLVIEFSRGGPHGASMPLPSPYGYKYAFSQLSPEILAKASILYIWVSPEESRRKNEARANPDDPGSILQHGVPLAVMYADYGCDDISYLLKASDKPETIKIHAYGKDYYLPVGRFDNRIDRTSFLRGDVASWKQEDLAALKTALGEAFRQLKEGNKK